MIRILLFLLVVFALGLGFSWLAERPGELVVTFAGYQYEVSLMVAAIIVTALVAAVMILWWLLKAIWTSPQTVARYFRVRRRDRGYQALSTGMIAAGAGDAGLARTKKREAMKLISADQEPLIHLLDAQASLLEGNHEDARRKFEAMLDDHPFGMVDRKADFTRHVLMFDQPLPEGIVLNSLPGNTEILRIDPREIYIAAYRQPNGRYTEHVEDVLKPLYARIGTSNLDTMRNWNTIEKIL